MVILKCLLLKTLIRDKYLTELEVLYLFLSFSSMLSFYSFVSIISKNLFDISFIACERFCLEKLFCLVTEKTNTLVSFCGGPRDKIQQSKYSLH